MPTISVSISDEMKDFVADVIQSGAYSNASEVFRDGLRAVQERQMRLQALRKHVQKAIAEEERYSDDEVEAFLLEEAAKEE